MGYVLDTSAILSRQFNLAGEGMIVPPSVVDEIRKGRLKAVLDSLEGVLKVMSPSEESLRKVRSKAEESGDLVELSDTDLDVLALANETGSTIISDDFDIQNVASMLSIPFMGAGLKGISQEVVWGYRCTGCRKRYSTKVSECIVCGHEVVRTRSASRKKSRNQKT